jgi:hypothetical protein
LKAEEKNSWEQKKKLHAMIRDIAQQVVFLGRKWDEKEWKFIIFASAHGQQLVPGIFGDGRLIAVNNKRVTGLLMPTMAELITQVTAYGNEQGVRWTDPEWQAYLREIAA